MTKKPKQYINNAYVNRVEGPYGYFLKMALRRDEFIKEISKIEPDAKGFVNLMLSEWRADPKKMSVSIDTWKPESDILFPEEPKSGAASNDNYASSSAQKAGNKVEYDDHSDLPF